MANIDDNLLVRGARGNVGKQFVYRKRGNKTFIERMPVTNEAAPSVKQEKMRDLFAAASAYAKGVIADAELKMLYGEKATPGTTAYNAAFKDFMKAPEVTAVNTERYNGTPGSTIVVVAVDDFRVAEVTVSIRTAEGILIEEGNAILNPINRDKWMYTARQSNAMLQGTVINVTARDLPGNKGRLAVAIS